MRRREFIAGLGGAAAWQFAAWAQQGNRMRRIGVLEPGMESDPGGKVQLSGFTQRLAELGWTDGRNLRIDFRWANGDADRIRMLAKELVGLQPDVILAHTTPVTAALQRETRTIPIVFLSVADPVGDGFVAGLARPGGNITGFINLEGAIVASGWSFSPRSRPVSSGLQSCSIPIRLPVVDHISCPLLRQPPDRSKWSRSRHQFVAMPKSKRS